MEFVYRYSNVLLGPDRLLNDILLVTVTYGFIIFFIDGWAGTTLYMLYLKGKCHGDPLFNILNSTQRFSR
jgi:hypothetical protein